MFLAEYRNIPIKLLKLSDEEFVEKCAENPNAIKNELRLRLVRLTWFGFVVGSLFSACLIGAFIMSMKIIQVI